MLGGVIRPSATVLLQWLGWTTDGQEDQLQIDHRGTQSALDATRSRCDWACIPEAREADSTELLERRKVSSAWTYDQREDRGSLDARTRGKSRNKTSGQHAKNAATADDSERRSREKCNAYAGRERTFSKQTRNRLIRDSAGNLAKPDAWPVRRRAAWPRNSRY